MSVTDDYALDDRWSYQDANEFGAAINALETIRSADPVSPTNNTWWIVHDSGTDTVSLRVRIAGVTYTLADIALPT